VIFFILTLFCTKH